MYNAVCKWLLEHAETGNRVDAFALEPFAGRRNALMEYLGMHAGRVKILESAPRIHLSDPANGTFTFPGLDGPGIPLRFVQNNIRYYNRLNTAFQRPLLDSFGVAEMKVLRGLLVLNIKYLRGCDSQWVSEPNGKFSSLAMLQDEALTVRVRAGAGNESSSSVEIVGMEPPRRPPLPQRRVPRCSQPPQGGVMVPAFTAGDDSDSDDTLLKVLDGWAAEQPNNLKRRKAQPPREGVASIRCV